MQILWQAPEPVLVRAVHTRLATERDIAYTTVMTTMARLAEKGILVRAGAGRGKTITYAAAMSEQAFVTHRLTDIIGAVARDYPAVLTHCLAARPDLAASS
jgi:predicted transcriptional regulator